MIRGTARLEDAHTIEVNLRDGGREKISAETILVATGSVISRLPVSGLEECGYWTSGDVLDRPELPASILVLGGGAIALEMAHYYEGLGVKVTVIQRSQQLLKAADADAAEALQKAMEKRGITVYTGTHLLGATREGDTRRVRFEYQNAVQEVSAEAILVAAGRSPNTGDLGLEAAGVKTSRSGGIEVDATQASSQAHIFAAGDVGSPLDVVHLAIIQAENAARNAAIALGKQPESSRATTGYRLKLYGIFTEPEIGLVGLTEKEAREQGLDVVAASYPFDDHGKSMISGALDGFVKLVAERPSGRLVGGAVIGPHGVDLIHEIVVAMAFNATARQLAEIPHYHPTLSEIWTYPAEEIAKMVDSQ